MNNPKMRTLLLCSFLFVTSLVIAKAGLTWTRDNDDGLENVVVEVEGVDHAIHLEHLEHLKANEARIRDHAERLAERIAAQVGVAVESGDFEFDFDHEFEHDGDGELMVRKKFDVSQGDALFIKVPGADVEVIAGSSNEVAISVFLDARDMDKARAYFEDLDFQVGSSGGEVWVKAQSADKGRWGWNRHGHAQILVRAEIPQEFNVDVSTSGGDISVEQLQGRLKLATSGGDIELGSISGEEILVNTSGGDIEAVSLTGLVKLTTSGGDIDIGTASGPELTIRTSGGDISSGELEAKRVDVRTSGGDISLGGVTGRAVVKTSGGDIEVGRMNGSLDAATSGGDIEVRVERASEMSLSTTGGSIEIQGPSDLGVDIKLRGSEVDVDGGLEFQGTKKKNVVDGSINGGGPMISATSSGGEISLELNR